MLSKWDELRVTIASRLMAGDWACEDGGSVGFARVFEVTDDLLEVSGLTPESVNAPPEDFSGSTVAITPELINELHNLASAFPVDHPMHQCAKDALNGALARIAREGEVTTITCVAPDPSEVSPC